MMIFRRKPASLTQAVESWLLAKGPASSNTIANNLGLPRVKVSSALMSLRRQHRVYVVSRAWVPNGVEEHTLTALYAVGDQPDAPLPALTPRGLPYKAPRKEQPVRRVSSVFDLGEFE